MKIITTEKGLVASALCYSIGFGFLCVIATFVYSGDLPSPSVRLALLSLSCVFILAGTRTLAKRKDSRQAEKKMKVALSFVFLLYLAFLITVTLFDPFFGRSGGGMLLSEALPDIQSVKEYAKAHNNLIPFDTVRRFCSIADNGDAGKRAFTVNVIGNLAAFSPLGFFLPVLFQKMRKFRYFITAVFLCVLAVESLQIILMTGSFDADDLILNCTGASVIFLILRIPPLRRAVNKLTLIET